MGSNVFSCTEAARCYPNVANAPSHDSFTRCLQRQPPDTEALWEEVKNHFKPKKGFLIVDDSTLDKTYAKEMDFVHRMWSGKHHRTVKGIGLVTLSWANGTTVIPIDFRNYNIDEDDKTKNDHFLDMLDKAEERGFNPEFVLFDTWYASVKNLKAVRNKEW
ncbi:transposase, partial [Methanosarcina sp. 2.H.T.1A.6]|uniref:transposase n=1 Tax=Methanosarcina sp. 2.H.T.1A.6 TaxID=1483599 RepID=UPI00138DEB52